MQIELSKPVNYRDGELEKIDLELENLTGYDVLSVESELRSAGINSPAWEYSREFLIALASRGSKLPAEVLKSLNVMDFTKIINEVLIFLAGTATATATAKSSGE